MNLIKFIPKNVVSQPPNFIKKSETMALPELVETFESVFSTIYNILKKRTESIEWIESQNPEMKNKFVAKIYYNYLKIVNKSISVFSWDSPKTSPARYVEIIQNSPQRRSIGSGYSSSNEPQNKVNVIHNATNVSYPVNYVDTLRSNISPNRTIGSAATSIIVKAKRREIAANSPQSINFMDASNSTTKTYSDVHQTSQNNTQQKINTNPIKHLVQTKPMSSADLFEDFTPKGKSHS